MTTPAQTATRVTALLLATRSFRPGASEALQTELYPILFRIAKGRAQSGVGTVHVGGSSVSVPTVRAADHDSVANDVTTHALERLIATAEHFDPDRGDGMSWALRGLNASYVHVVRQTYEWRRTLSMVPTESDALQSEVDRQDAAPDPAAVVEARAALNAALQQLTDEEERVFLGVKHYGYSYAEVALLVYGAETETARVAQTLRRAGRTLKRFEERWHAELAAGESAV